MIALWVFSDWGQVAEAVMAIGALAAIVVAWLQLGAMKGSQKASVLDQLDSKWLSNPVIEARKAVDKL